MGGHLQGLSSTKELGVGSLILAGGLGGIAYWGPTYPMDVIKSRIQVDNLQHPQYRGMMDCFSKVHRPLLGICSPLAWPSKVHRPSLAPAAHLLGLHVILTTISSYDEGSRGHD